MVTNLSRRAIETTIDDGDEAETGIARRPRRGHGIVAFELFGLGFENEASWVGDRRPPREMLPELGEMLICWGTSIRPP